MTHSPSATPSGGAHPLQADSELSAATDGARRSAKDWATVSSPPVEKRAARPRLKGRQATPEAKADLAALFADRTPKRDELIEYLHAIQDAHGALSPAHLVALAEWLKLSVAQVYEVASFYHHFEVLGSGEDAPELTVRVCSGLSCALAGASALQAELERLNANPRVKVIAAPCVGRCEQAPVAVVHQRPVAQATAKQVLQHVAQGEHQALLGTDQARFNPVDKALGEVVNSQERLSTCVDAVGLQAYLAQGGYRLLAQVQSGLKSKEAVLAAMQDSGLRGLGGAGFPAGRKWRIVAAQPGPRLLVVNLDEGEPGTFKDRTYLERDPHRFFEGMLIAAHVVGVEAIYIYLRDEYHACRALLEREWRLLQAQTKGVLPRVELRRGAGAYICGEESALIESLEGKRGEPRLRPPYIAEVGLFGRPTLAHNFETLYWVRDLIERGPDWFKGFGRHQRVGLRSFSLSGRVQRPGVKLAPAGITVRELIEEYGGGMLPGHQFYAYMPGGASGGILPASLGDVPLDFDTLQAYGCFIGSAAVIVLSDHDQARAAALNVMQFFAHESCGQCTPCRVGTNQAALLMQNPKWDQETLQDLAQVMADASICGLGQAAPNPIRSVLLHFKHEVS